MKSKVFGLLLMLAGIVCAAGLILTSLAVSSIVPLRVLSLNVLNDDTKNARFPYIRAVIDDLQPDIFGFQECREFFLLWLRRFKRWDMR